MNRPRFTIGTLMAATAVAALLFTLLRALGPNPGLPLLASWILGVVAWLGCRRRWGLAPALLGLAYLAVAVGSVIAGEGAVNPFWLVLLTVLTYPTILGAGSGSWAASKHLPPGHRVAAYDDLILILTVLPLVIVLPAIFWVTLLVLTGARGGSGIAEFRDAAAPPPRETSVMRAPRFTIGWLMVVVAGSGVVLALGMQAPAVLLLLVWLWSVLIGFALGRRWPELSLPVAILLNVSAGGVALGIALAWAGVAANLLLIALVNGALLTLAYPAALGCVLGRVGQPMPHTPDRISDGWLVMLAFLPGSVVGLLMVGAIGWLHAMRYV